MSNFQKWEKLKKDLLSSKEMEGSDIYVFFKENDCLYVGKSNNLRRRIGYQFMKHLLEDLSDEEMVDEYLVKDAYFKILPMESKGLDEFETYLISELNPIYTIDGKGVGKHVRGGCTILQYGMAGTENQKHYKYKFKRWIGAVQLR
ncbi:MAG: GIY-YIG nuclease family protein [Methanocellales archaeon]|nr:GIY-YIG nuclease family protein [Methanocellales archaeon]